MWQTAIYACGFWLTTTLVSQLDDPSPPHQRPRTRSWLKQESERKRRGTAAPLVNPIRRISLRQRGLQPGEHNDQLQEPRRDQPQASAKITSRTKQNRGSSKKQALPAQRVGKQIAQTLAKHQTKRKQASSRPREDRDKTNKQRRGGTGHLQVTIPLRSRYSLDIQSDQSLTQIGP